MKRRRSSRVIGSVIDRGMASRERIRRGRVLRPVGDKREVVFDETCAIPRLVSTLTPGASSVPGSLVAVVGVQGGSGLVALESTVRGQPAGSALQGHTIPAGLPASGPREYRSLFPDPVDSDKLHILKYLDGVFVSVVNTIDFADGENVGSLLDAATPIKGVAGVANGLAFPVNGPPGELAWRVVDEVAGTFSEATSTTGATGFQSSGSLYIQGLSLFVTCIDFDGPDNDLKLFRMTLPGIGDLTELAALATPGGSAYFHPGIWMPDRHRAPEGAGGTWIGIDDSFFSASTATTADIINLDSASRIWPLGHDGTDGYFLWSNGGILKFGKIATSGSGVDLGFSADWEDDFVQNVIFSGVWPNRFVTVVGVKSPSQDAAGDEPRAATLAFTGSPTALPEPFTVELEAAEAALGIGAGEAYPFAFLPWFP